MQSKNILITGSSGQLGTQFKLSENAPIDKFFYTPRSKLDITNYEQLADFIISNEIDIVINCAAYTKVDEAEDFYVDAYNINKEGCKNLAEISSLYEVIIIHISTDFVFDSPNKIFLDEKSPTNPVSVYGKSKLAGENEFFFKSNAKFIIIRSGWLYSLHGKNFLNTIIRLLNAKDSIGVIADQFGTPTNCKDLVDAVFNIIKHPNFENFSIKQSLYHFSNSDFCSWYDFAIEIKKGINSNCNVLPIKTSEYKSKARRPRNSILNLSKMKKDFDIEALSWNSSLSKTIQKII